MLERSVDLGEVTLAILEGGEPGARPLMLVHGFSGAKEDFAQEIDRLAGRGHHVVAPDQRGHGASSQPERMDAYSLEIFAEDMVGLADRLGWTTFDLLGHSMGGMIAQVMIAEHPERISRLILMDTHHGRIGGLDQSIIDIGVQIALDQGLAVIHELLSMGDAPLGTEADQRMRAADPTYAEWSDSKLFACSNYMYASMLSMFNTVPDRLDALHAITGAHAGDGRRRGPAVPRGIRAHGRGRARRPTRCAGRRRALAAVRSPGCLAGIARRVPGR